MSSVHNHASNTSGSVIQARDIEGGVSITFGSEESGGQEHNNSVVFSGNGPVNVIEGDNHAPITQTFGKK